MEAASLVQPCVCGQVLGVTKSDVGLGGHGGCPLICQICQFSTVLGKLEIRCQHLLSSGLEKGAFPLSHKTTVPRLCLKCAILSQELREVQEEFFVHLVHQRTLAGHRSLTRHCSRHQGVQERTEQTEISALKELPQWGKEGHKQINRGKRWKQQMQLRKSYGLGEQGGPP